MGRGSRAPLVVLAVAAGVLLLASSTAAVARALLGELRPLDFAVTPAPIAGIGQVRA